MHSDALCPDHAHRAAWALVEDARQLCNRIAHARHAFGDETDASLADAINQLRDVAQALARQGGTRTIHNAKPSDSPPDGAAGHHPWLVVASLHPDDGGPR